MRVLHYGFMVVCALTLFMGCSQQESAKSSGSPAPAPSSPAAGHLDRALPKLATIKLWLGDQELNTEVARTPVELQTGMMFRTNMADNEAMLFVFARTFRASFYMRNTKVPLTAAYLDPDGVILELHDLQPLNERPEEADSDRVQFVLETPQGWFQRHHITTGAVVRTQYGALRELNWGTLRPARGR